MMTIFRSSLILLKLVASLILTGCNSPPPSAHAPVAKAASSLEQPNIMWLVTEDNSKHYLSLFNRGGANMPTIDSLAAEGLVFENAFANSPVCSTARTTLATGAYATSIGTMNHRGYEDVTLPEHFLPFTALLKKAGYYTSNRAKTDYNFKQPEGTWDDSSSLAHWRNRAEGQPFFYMQTFSVTHEGKLHFPAAAITNQKTKHNPNDIELAPIYPNTEIFRYTHARVLDNHVKADKQIARVIEELEQDGELENTFIFYFGDHGGVLPGSKGYVFETGLSVPLVIRIPENFKHLVGSGLKKGNTRVTGFVSFIDFAPTVLSLVGIEPPKEYPGQTFLSADIDINTLNRRDEVFAQADRFDEKSDFVRSVRKGNFKYIRSYQPYYPNGLNNYYRYKQFAYQEWRELFKADKLSPVQAAFFEPKSAEALYNLSSDPFETKNLVGNLEYKDTLMALRALLRQNQRKYPDLGFIAESKLLQTPNISNYYDYSIANNASIQQLIDIANLPLFPFAEVSRQLHEALTDPDENKVYRALIAATSFGDEASELTPLITKLMIDSSSILVRSRALEFLTLVGDMDPTDHFAQLYQQAEHDMEKLELLNIATLLKEQKGYTFAMSPGAISQRPEPDSPSFKVNTWLYNRWDYITADNL